MSEGEKRGVFSSVVGVSTDLVTGAVVVVGVMVVFVIFGFDYVEDGAIEYRRAGEGLVVVGLLCFVHLRAGC